MAFTGRQVMANCSVLVPKPRGWEPKVIDHTGCSARRRPAPGA
ncbi:UNVERIFIED_ORG: hypothetical protein ABIB19_002463 [Arthrobacter sp. UYEF10]